MHEIGDIRLANLELVIAELGSLERLAVAADTSSVYLSQIRNRAQDSKTGRPRQMGTAMARRIETAAGKPPGWMDVHHTMEPPAHGWDPAHILRPGAASNTPHVSWGERMSTELPAIFCVAIPDDSMAPRVRRGDVVRFSRSELARPGDGVLVSDRAGAWFFRIYRERRPGEWEAHPLNAAYQPLDAQHDGLRVLAVLVGIESQRWG